MKTYAKKYIDNVLVKCTNIMFIGEVVENKIYGEVTGNWYD